MGIETKEWKKKITGKQRISYQMGVSYYNTKSAGKMRALTEGGGSINRLQVYIGDTSVN